MGLDTEEAIRRLNQRLTGFRQREEAGVGQPSSLVFGSEPRIQATLQRPGGGTVTADFDPRVQGARRESVIAPLRAVQEANVAGSLAAEEVDPDFGAVSIQPPAIQELIRRTQRIKTQAGIEGGFQPTTLTGTPELRGEVTRQLSAAEQLRQRAGDRAATRRFLEVAPPEFKRGAIGDVQAQLGEEPTEEPIGAGDIQLPPVEATEAEKEGAFTIEERMIGEANERQRREEARAFGEQLRERARKRRLSGSAASDTETATSVLNKALADFRKKRDAELRAANQQKTADIEKIRDETRKKQEARDEKRKIEAEKRAAARKAKEAKTQREIDRGERRITDRFGENVSLDEAAVRTVFGYDLADNPADVVSIPDMPGEGDESFVIAVRERYNDLFNLFTGKARQRTQEEIDAAFQAAINQLSDKPREGHKESPRVKVQRGFDAFKAERDKGKPAKAEPETEVEAALDGDSEASRLEDILRPIEGGQANPVAAIIGAANIIEQAFGAMDEEAVRGFRRRIETILNTTEGADALTADQIQTIRKILGR